MAAAQTASFRSRPNTAAGENPLESVSFPVSNIAIPTISTRDAMVAPGLLLTPAEGPTMSAREDASSPFNGKTMAASPTSNTAYFKPQMLQRQWLGAMVSSIHRPQLSTSSTATFFHGGMHSHRSSIAASPAQTPYHEHPAPVGSEMAQHSAKAHAQFGYTVLPTASLSSDSSGSMSHYHQAVRKISLQGRNAVTSSVNALSMSPSAKPLHRALPSEVVDRRYSPKLSQKHEFAGPEETEAVRREAYDKIAAATIASILPQKTWHNASEEAVPATNAFASRPNTCATAIPIERKASPHYLDVLSVEFDRARGYPSQGTLQCLARDLGMTVHEVQTWFDKRRKRMIMEQSQGATPATFSPPSGFWPHHHQQQYHWPSAAAPQPNFAPFGLVGPGQPAPMQPVAYMPVMTQNGLIMMPVAGTSQPIAPAANVFGHPMPYAPAPVGYPFPDLTGMYPAASNHPVNVSTQQHFSTSNEQTSRTQGDRAAVQPSAIAQHAPLHQYPDTKRSRPADLRSPPAPPCDFAQSDEAAVNWSHDVQTQQQPSTHAIANVSSLDPRSKLGVFAGAHNVDHRKRTIDESISASEVPTDQTSSDEFRWLRNWIQTGHYLDDRRVLPRAQLDPKDEAEIAEIATREIQARAERIRQSCNGSAVRHFTPPNLNAADATSTCGVVGQSEDGEVKCRQIFMHNKRSSDASLALTSPRQHGRRFSPRGHGALPMSLGTPRDFSPLGNVIGTVPFSHQLKPMPPLARIESRALSPNDKRQHTGTEFDSARSGDRETIPCKRVQYAARRKVSHRAERDRPSSIEEEALSFAEAPESSSKKYLRTLRKVSTGEWVTRKAKIIIQRVQPRQNATVLHRRSSTANKIVVPTAQDSPLAVEANAPTRSKRSFAALRSFTGPNRKASLAPNTKETTSAPPSLPKNWRKILHTWQR